MRPKNHPPRPSTPTARPNSCPSGCCGIFVRRRRCATSCCATSTWPAPTRRAASGKRPFLTVFGTDYPTPDGTGVRDYIHVEDLASAHLNALDYLRAGGKSLVANVGYGRGYSVREVLSSVEKIAGLKLDIREEPRRAGDPPSLVARCERVRELLKWQPKLDDIDTIVRTSLDWEKRLQREPW
jgi:UDP-glucose 4-epimerase